MRVVDSSACPGSTCGQDACRKDAALTWFAPRTIDEALPLLTGGARVIAGGTDLLAAEGRALPNGDLVDLAALPGAREIARSDAGWRIGARVTWSDVVAADLPPAFDGLKAAAREVGGIQIQNAGTLVGNICNASPAADGMPCLLALEARVEIAAPSGTRDVALSDFVLGPRRIALGAGEIVTAILVPPQGNAVSAFAKLGARRYLVISIAMVAVVLRQEGARIGSARVSVGACGPVATRIPGLEEALAGCPAAEAAARVEPAHFAHLAPIDDIRADAAYRRAAAVELTRRALTEAVAR